MVKPGELALCDLTGHQDSEQSDTITDLCTSGPGVQACGHNLGVFVWVRPLKVGQGALTGIAELANIAAAAGADEVVLVWETHDVATACELPIVGLTPCLNIVLASREGHILHQSPYSEQFLSRSPEGWAPVAPGWRPAPAPQPGGELVPPIQAAVDVSFTPIELDRPDPFGVTVVKGRPSWFPRCPDALVVVDGFGEPRDARGQVLDPGDGRLRKRRARVGGLPPLCRHCGAAAPANAQHGQRRAPIPGASAPPIPPPFSSTPARDKGKAAATGMSEPRPRPYGRGDLHSFRDVGQARARDAAGEDARVGAGDDAARQHNRGPGGPW